MKRIAVGVDFSPESEVAARRALEVARRLGGQLVLVHVETFVELPPPEQPAAARMADTYRARVAASLEADRRRLAELRERLAGQGPEVSQVVAEGFADEGLVEATDALDADLLVVGSHGRGALRWFLLGGVAQHALRHLERDVLVARAGREVGFRRVAVATDFSPVAERALDRALAMAAPDAAIDVVHCYRLPTPVELGDGVGWGITAEVERELVAEVTERGQRLIDGRGLPDQRLRFHAVAARPVPGVVHWVEEHRCDLVALGSHGRRGFRRAVLGSVADAVSRKAPCSVLVCHPAAAAAG
jgi:universal stress protein E